LGCQFHLLGLERSFQFHQFRVCHSYSISCTADHANPRYRIRSVHVNRHRNSCILFAQHAGATAAAEAGDGFRRAVECRSSRWRITATMEEK
jgi:hypothetical protein